MRGRFASSTGSAVSRHAARMGSAPFLLPAARTRPFKGRPPSITNDSATGLASVVDTDGSMLIGDAEDPGGCVGNPHALHEERGAPAPRARRRGVGRLVRAGGRRARGAVAGRGAAARLRLR